MKIGLISDSFRLPFAESISAAAKLGVTGVQKYMTGGPFSAEAMTSEKIREIRDIIETAYARCEQMLRDNLDLLHRVAGFLLKHETMDGSQFEALYNGEEPVVAAPVQETPVADATETPAAEETSAQETAAEEPAAQDAPADSETRE